MSKTIDLSDSELEALWSRGDAPDLILDADDGTLRPIGPEPRTASRTSSVARGVGRAVAAAPAAAAVVISDVARWD